MTNKSTQKDIIFKKNVGLGFLLTVRWFSLSQAPIFTFVSRSEGNVRQNY